MFWQRFKKIKSKDKVTSYHFWLGQFDSEEDVKNYFQETYLEDQDLLFSKFIEDQKVEFVDHDFLEYSFSTIDKPFIQRFSDNSYSKQWSQWLFEKAKNKNLLVSNTVIFLKAEEIEIPLSCHGRYYSLNYIGEFKVNT